MSVFVALAADYRRSLNVRGCCSVLPPVHLLCCEQASPYICIGIALVNALPSDVFSLHLPSVWRDVADFIVPFTNILKTELGVTHSPCTSGQLSAKDVLWQPPVLHALDMTLLS